MRRKNIRTAPDPATAHLDREIARREAKELSQDFYRFVKEAWPIVEPGQPFLDGFHVRAICEHLQACADRRIKKLLINVPPRHTKPVSEEALVSVYGGRKRLADIVVGDRVLTHKGNYKPVLAVHIQGVLPSVTIDTFCGRKLVCAPDHPVWTARGWKNAGDIEEGDLLGSPVPNVPTEAPITDQDIGLARIAGYIVGDGNVTGSACVITCFDDVEGADIEASAKASGFSCAKKPRGIYALSEGTKPPRAWLREIGLSGGTSYTKFIPDFVLKSDTLIKNFLACYFACDGTLTKKGAARKDLEVSITSVNRHLLEQVQDCLARFGIRTRIRTRIHNNNPWVPKGYTYYCLAMSDSDSTDLFRQHIVPYLTSVKKSKYLEWPIHRQKFDQAMLGDSVISVTKTEPVPMRCLTVADDSSFVANGLAVHNSTLCSVLFQAWVWTRNPHERFLYASYSSSLAIRDATNCRRIIESDWYRERWPHVQMVDDNNLKASYENTMTGRRQTTSVGGTVTGLGGTFLILDDPHNVKDAESSAVREQAVQWFRESWMNRTIGKDTVRIVIMQRVHSSDVSAYCETEGDWVQLFLTMEYDGHKKPPTPLGWQDPREDFGELLWPQRYEPSEVASLKKSMGEYAYAAQYQQTPVPRGGGLIRKAWLRFWYDPLQGTPEPVPYQDSQGNWHECFQQAIPPGVKPALASWDLAFKGGSTSDFVVGQVWGKGDAARFYLLFQSRARRDFPETLAAMREVSVDYPTEITLVEEAANGAAAIAVLQAEIPGLVAVRPEGGKDSRAAAMAPLFEAGQIYFPHPEQNPWVAELINEVTMFPKAPNDDQVDCISQAMVRLRNRAVDIVELGTGGGGLDYADSSWVN